MDFFLKPIFWNGEGYRKPAGGAATAGYPSEYGFGHEEWNNSDKLAFDVDGAKYRAFYTQDLERAKGKEANSFVFLIASYKGGQYLVGIAGCATRLPTDRSYAWTEALAKLALDDLWHDAWNVQTVQNRFANQNVFLEFWNYGGGLKPNWVCPQETFWWLPKPVELIPKQITGKAKLVQEYSSFHEISAMQACIVMEQVPAVARNATWYRLYSTIYSGDLGLEDDIVQIQDLRNVKNTDKLALTQARIGQGKFRNDLERMWGDKCAVTGCAVREVLRASHVKPWRDSSNDERLNSHNGLLLAAHVDALFDRGLISFSGSGEMLVSSRIGNSQRELLGIPAPLRCKPSKELQEFLKHHRRAFGFPE